MRRIGWIAGIVAILLLLGLGASQVLRDTTPPRLFVEAPSRAVAGSAAEVFASANEPVTLTLRYADVVVEEVTQDVTVSLLVEPGSRILAIHAADAAGNVAEWRSTIVGVEIPRPELRAPTQVEAGVPVTLELHWQPDSAEVSAAGITADGVAIPVVRQRGRAIGFFAAPLATQPSAIVVEGWVVDVMGTRHRVAGQVSVAADATPVEQLNIPASTLSVITPEGRVLEREALAGAYASPLPALRWREPFILPVDGIVTSAYGNPRRYAPGGPVSFHTGTDLRAPTGTPILATNDGVVRVADFYPIKGGLVAIDHGGGVTSLYFHQSEIFVEVGDVVERGQPIGASGATGLVSGPHLHWEMQVLGRPSDPLAWVDRIVPGASLASAP